MTLHSRPRQSILSFFDPLAPATPPRNDSPGEESDKENEDPPRNDLTLTTFFNRTYKAHLQPIPKPLRLRLIDVGDVTADTVDPWLLDGESDEPSPDANEFEDNETDTLTFRQMAEAATPKWNVNKTSTFSTPSPSAPRTPLAELPIDQATPKVYGRQPLSSELARIKSPQIFVSSVDSPQRAPIDNGSYHRPHSTVLEEDETAVSRLSVSPNPLINSVSSVNLPSASVSGSLLVDTIIPSIFTPSVSLSEEQCVNDLFDKTRLRAYPPTTSSADRSRHSVDLQSSFQLHMGDEGTEFNLLNDKISFFGASKNGMESYMDDDPSFDMSFGDSTPVERSEKDSCFPMIEPSPSESHCPIDAIGQPKEANEVSAAAQPSILKDTSWDDKGHQSLVAETPKHSRGVLTGPPPIVGLRIIKRTQLAMKKSTSSLRTTSNPDPLLKKPPVQPVANKYHEPSQVRRNVPQATSSQARNRNEITKPASDRVSSAGANRTGGPRRVLVTDEPEKGAGARRNVGVVGGRSAIGPRRVPVGEAKGSVSENSGKQASASSIPKAQPIRRNAGSSLPQPIARTSRLPAPSVAVHPTGLPARETYRRIPVRRAI